MQNCVEQLLGLQKMVNLKLSQANPSFREEIEKKVNITASFQDSIEKINKAVKDADSNSSTK